jgi:predicted RNase H-like HicB family nuclease
VWKDSEGFFLASEPALAICYTQARSLDELMELIKEAIELCFEVQENDFEQLDLSVFQRVTV